MRPIPTLEPYLPLEDSRTRLLKLQSGNTKTSNPMRTSLLSSSMANPTRLVPLKVVSLSLIGLQTSLAAWAVA